MPFQESGDDHARPILGGKTRFDLEAACLFLVLCSSLKRQGFQKGGEWGKMDKRSLNERDICTKFITPALVSAGWDVDDQIREEVSFTKGRIIVRGKMVSRGEGKRADYILSAKPNIPIAIIEAKDNKQPIGGGIQQALGYA